MGKESSPLLEDKQCVHVGMAKEAKPECVVKAVSIHIQGINKTHLKMIYCEEKAFGNHFCDHCQLSVGSSLAGVLFATL